MKLKPRTATLLAALLTLATPAAARADFVPVTAPSSSQAVQRVVVSGGRWAALAGGQVEVSDSSGQSWQTIPDPVGGGAFTDLSVAPDGAIWGVYYGPPGFSPNPQLARLGPGGNSFTLQPVTMPAIGGTPQAASAPHWTPVDRSSSRSAAARPSRRGWPRWMARGTSRQWRA